jgi:hypothetical protein
VVVSDVYPRGMAEDVPDTNPTEDAMSWKRWFVAPLLLVAVGVISLGGRGRDGAVAQAADRQTGGRYQISAFPARPPQFGYEHNVPGCYMVDTATGELWILNAEGQGKGVWKRCADGPH